MRITTWNVNGIRAREDRVLNWLDANRPDVLCLQELKCTEEQFPYDGFDELGYQLAIHGQKSWNGVAVVSLDFPDAVEPAVPWAEDDQARGIAATVGGVEVVSLYVPNGRSVDNPAYQYKLEWLEQLRAWLDGRDAAVPLVLCGDYNIAPDDRDVYDAESWGEAVLCSPPERERLQALLDWGLEDAYRLIDESGVAFTWWDYRGASLQRNQGLRIDHHLISQPLVERLSAVEIDLEERRAEKASDHAPVTLVLDE